MNAASIKQHRVTRQQPCPVCRKTHGCLLFESHVVCLRVMSDRSWARVVWAVGGTLFRNRSFIEQLFPLFFSPAVSVWRPPAHSTRSIGPHGHLTLTAHHKKHLTQERQLSLEAIAARGYQSWGQGIGCCVRAWPRFFTTSLVAWCWMRQAFLLREQGRTYLTLGGPAGICIPVRNTEEQIVAHQYPHRLARRLR